MFLSVAEQPFAADRALMEMYDEDAHDDNDVHDAAAAVAGAEKPRGW